MKASAIKVNFDRYSMMVNGQREFIRSGAMHYFRLPGQDLWKDRLYKLKAAGYNTVDLYFCWAYHSARPGEYDFTGIRDIKALLKIAEDLGFFLIARPGPYINAEYTAGGLPGWLVARQDLHLRNRTSEGKFIWSEPYMEAVREWWGQIVPFFRDYPYLLMMQIENEYATLDMEPEYLQELYKMSRDLGITVPLMHNDMYTAGLFEEVVDIYAFDNYSVTQFDKNWRTLDGVFSVLDSIEDSIRPYCQNRPLMVAELQAGWFAGWKGYPYETIIEHLGREHINLITKTLIAQGLTIFNHYKAIGGTNWGYIGSTDTYTSYDFGAPISEAGINTDRLYEAKKMNYFLQTFDVAHTDRVSDSPFKFVPYTEATSAGLPTGTPHTPASDFVFAVRKGLSEQAEKDGSLWIFLRNISTRPVAFELTWDDGGALPKNHYLPPFTMQILPYHVRLANGYLLKFATTELIYQNKNVLIINGTGDLHFELEPGNIDIFSYRNTSSSIVNMKDVHARFTVSSGNDYAYMKLGNLHIYALGPDLADRMWLEEDGNLVLGASARLQDPAYGILENETELLNILPHGELVKVENVRSTSQPYVPPVLKHWKTSHEAPELYNNEGFHPVSPNGADLDANVLYEGSAWYRYRFTGKTPKTLTIVARHIWGVFLNGKFLGEGHHWQSIQDEPIPGPQKVPVPQDLLKIGEENDLVIFVDGLGHPKGFHDDAQLPQGLLHLKLDDEDVTQSVQISAGLNDWKAPIRQALGLLPDHSPLVRLETHFPSPDRPDLDIALGVSLQNLDYERVNIYLNGFLIGRHWRACQRQTLYYIPTDLLKAPEAGENLLELILINFDPLIPLNACTPGPEDVSIQPYGVFTKITL